MRGKRFSEEQMITVLKEAEAGAKTADLCRRRGISEQTVYRCKARYAGLEVSELRRLRQLEDENTRLKHLVADLTLDDQASRSWSEKRPEARSAAGAGAGSGELLRAQRAPGLRARGCGALDGPVYHVVDAFSPKWLGGEVDASLPGERVVQVLDRLAGLRGRPEDPRGVRAVHPTPGRGGRTLNLSGRKQGARHDVYFQF